MDEKFKRHMGKPVRLKLGEDDFEFSPMKIGEFRDIMVAAKKISREGVSEDAYGEAIDSIFSIWIKIIKRSYPELKDDEIERFIISNMNSLVNMTIEMAGVENPVDDAKKLFEK